MGLGCQMVCIQTKNPNLGKFWRALEWKMLVYFTAIWNIFRPFEIFYGRLVTLWLFGKFSPRFGISCHEKSGNPGWVNLSSRTLGELFHKLFFPVV
jgi:hypothetical protein